MRFRNNGKGHNRYADDSYVSFLQDGGDFVVTVHNGRDSTVFYAYEKREKTALLKSFQALCLALENSLDEGGK